MLADAPVPAPAPPPAATPSRGAYLQAALASYVVWSWLVFPIRWVQGVPPVAVMGLRISYAAILMALFLLGFQRRRLRAAWQHYRSLSPRLRRSNTWRLLLGGVILVLNWGMYIFIVNEVNLRTASFGYLINPVLVAVLAYLLLRERLTRWQWVAVALAAGSCVLLGIENQAEVAYSLLVAATWASYLLTQRPVVIDRLVVAGVHFLAGALLMLPLLAWWAPQLPPDPWLHAKVLLMASLFTIVPQSLNLFALQGLPSGQLAMLGYLNPILVFAYGWLFFGERASILQWLGYAVLIGALALFNWARLQRLYGRVHQRLYREPPSLPLP